ncbi:MAG TPA: exodeoxyribonuclease V subunit alpha [Pseudomonadales bacterium]|nr:exodeoxyribonuclease V subunit alpha [Pseudomonadales bacterium]
MVSSQTAIDWRKQSGELADIDIYFAEFMADIANTTDHQLINAFAELSHAQLNQHACLDISGRIELVQKLKDLDCVTEVDPQDNNVAHTPLVLTCQHQQYKLYLQRYHQYESNIARHLITRNKTVDSGTGYVDILDLLFPDSSDTEVDFQKVAAFQCVTRQLTIITGGPGTGKSSTVVKILAAMIDQQPDLKVKLAAPTGKAAARLGESIKSALSSLPGELGDKVRSDVSTIHRLLGMRGDGHSFRHDQQNPISVDLLVLDEVSMIDLAMFDRPLDALPATTRLILLGDPGQLPSVDNGAVLDDLCKLGVNYDESFAEMVETNLSVRLPTNLPEGQESNHKLCNAICRLTKSYRFDDDTGIGALAQAIRDDHTPQFTDNEQVRFIVDYSPNSLVEDMLAQYQTYLTLVQSEAPARQLIEAFEQVRILSPGRDGEYGVIALNTSIEAHIHPNRGMNPYYHGKPIIITRNDYNLRLFNGDIGICVNNRKGEIEVAFKGEDGEIDYYLASRLPPFETCFVMTVHKAQGSEFSRVSLVLPNDLNEIEELANRNLIYTAITRTSQFLSIYSSTENLHRCLRARSARFGGMTERFLQPSIIEASSIEASSSEGSYKVNEQLGLFDE